MSVAFRPDGKQIASGSSDQTIRLWNLETGESLTTLEGHSAWVLSVAFSPDGKQIASGSSDQTIRLWYSYHLEELADTASRRTTFEKIFRASLDWMRFRRVDLRFESTPDRPSLIPLNGYTFPQPRRPPRPLERPRPPGKDPLEWLLENAE